MSQWSSNSSVSVYKVTNPMVRNINLFMISAYSKRKKPGYSLAILSSSNCCRTSQRRYPKKAFSQKSLFNEDTYTSGRENVNCSTKKNWQWQNRRFSISTSLATFERALYRPIQTGIVTRVGKHPIEGKCQRKYMWITNRRMYTKQKR